MAVLVSCLVIRAEEPADAFLQALRERGYFDIALEYLADMESSDLISPEFREAIPFERADTLIDSTSRLRDLSQVEARLDEAQNLLTEYASRNKSLEVSGRTFRYQGNLLYQRSNLYIAQAKNDRLTAAEKEVFDLKARQMLEQALDSYQKARAMLRRLIDPNSPDGIKIDAADPSTKRKLNQLETQYTQVRLRLPNITEQLADTYADGAPQRLEYLNQAVREYGEIYSKYRSFLPGLYAKVYQGRCLQKLGNHAQAIIEFNESFALGDNGALKGLKKLAYLLACDSWARIEPYPFAEVVQRLEGPVSVLNRDEVRDPDWMRIQFELAKGKYAQAGAVKAAGGPKAGTESRTIEREAAKLLRNIARIPGPLRDQSRELLASWDVKVNVESNAAAEAAPEVFEDARQRGKDLIGELEILVSERGSLTSQVQAANNVDEKARLVAGLGEIENQITSLSDSALAMFELSLDLANAQTPRQDLNNVRYLQSYCYFVAQRYLESAIIGEFLLDKYPNVDGTKQAMPLLVRSHSLLVNQAEEADKPFAQQRLKETCLNIVKRWQGSNEAGVAATRLTELALSDKDLATAQTYFAMIPDDASTKAMMGSFLAQRLWFDLKGRLEGGESTEASAAELATVKQYMLDGLKTVDLDTLNYDSAIAALLLVDVHLAGGEIEAAVNRLGSGGPQSAAIAPLDLVKQKIHLEFGPQKSGLYARETYKIAVKTYLEAMRVSDDKQFWIEQANGVISAMRQDAESSEDPAAKARLTTIYSLIATELKQNFEKIRSPQEKKNFAGSLSNFLGSIGKESTDAKTVLWAGSTLLGVAESLSDSDLKSDSRPIFEQAVAALTRAQQMGFTGDPQAAQMALELKRQRALAQRGSGEYAKAIEQLAAVLAERPTALNIQVDACETLQMWAAAKQDVKYYIQAIKGAEPQLDAKTKRQANIIWGWEKIALATRKDDRFRDVYFNALYHIVECRMAYGQLTDKPSAIESAGREIANERRRDPTFQGDPKWKAKFDALEKRVNEAK